MQQEVENGWIYAGYTPDLSIIKIGYTTDPTRRFKELRWEGKQLVPFGAMPGTTTDETALTSKFSHLCVSGKDWFRWDNSIVDNIRALPLQPVALECDGGTFVRETKAVTVRVPIDLFTRMEERRFTTRASFQDVALRSFEKWCDPRSSLTPEQSEAFEAAKMLVTNSDPEAQAITALIRAWAKRKQEAA